MAQTLQSMSDLVNDVVGSSNLECFRLYEFAKSVENLNGEIVEVGSLYGKTAIALALAAKEQGHKVICIDHFFQYPDLNTCVIDIPYPHISNIEDAYSKNTYIQFTKHLIERNLFEDVVILASKSENAASIWTKPIKFIFIDADHSYDGVKRDFTLFAPFVVSGGLISLHDVSSGHPGVYKFFHEIMSTGKYEQVWDGEGNDHKIIRKK